MYLCEKEGGYFLWFKVYVYTPNRKKKKAGGNWDQAPSGFEGMTLQQVILNFSHTFLHWKQVIVDLATLLQACAPISV
jgi:hypothetical protein